MQGRQLFRLLLASLERYTPRSEWLCQYVLGIVTWARAQHALLFAATADITAAAVLGFGEVDFLHPAFHDEKTIYPVGYCAIRVTASQASNMETVSHLCEVMAAEDGSGPIFRSVLSATVHQGIWE